MSTAQPGPSDGGMSEAEIVVRLLGADPWVRFDLWAGRAWEASERAIGVATANGPPVGQDDGLDSRIMSLLHAAEVAKEFAEMVNPLHAVSETECVKAGDAARRADQAIGMIIDEGLG